jgi:hypothetical protein
VAGPLEVRRDLDQAADVAGDNGVSAGSGDRLCLRRGRDEFRFLPSTTVATASKVGTAAVSRSDPVALEAPRGPWPARCFCGRGPNPCRDALAQVQEALSFTS